MQYQILTEYYTAINLNVTTVAKFMEHKTKNLLKSIITRR